MSYLLLYLFAFVLMIPFEHEVFHCLVFVSVPQVTLLRPNNIKRNWHKY